MEAILNPISFTKAEISNIIVFKIILRLYMITNLKVLKLTMKPCALKKTLNFTFGEISN